MAQTTALRRRTKMRPTTAASPLRAKNESSLHKLANIDEAAAEQAALKAVPGTVHEAELETSDNGYVVYDIELAGKDGNKHEVKVDAGNGEILHQDLEDEADESDEADEPDEADEVD